MDIARQVRDEVGAKPPLRLDELVEPGREETRLAGRDPRGADLELDVGPHDGRERAG